MWPLSVILNHYRKNFHFVFIQYKKGRMLRISTEAMFNKPPGYRILFLNWLDTKWTNIFFLIQRMNTNF